MRDESETDVGIPVRQEVDIVKKPSPILFEELFSRVPNFYHDTITDIDSIVKGYGELGWKGRVGIWIGDDGCGYPGNI